MYIESFAPNGTSPDVAKECEDVSTWTLFQVRNCNSENASFIRVLLFVENVQQSRRRAVDRTLNE